MRFLCEVQEYDKITVSFYKDRFSCRGKTLREVITGDPAETILCIADHLRSETWGREVVGVSHPCPNHQVALSRWDKNLGDVTRSIFTMVDKGWLKHLSRGKRIPYVGSMTRMKIRKSNLDIFETNSMITNLKKILTIGPWARSASDKRI